jgi:hypothetical protein
MPRLTWLVRVEAHHAAGGGIITIALYSEIAGGEFPMTADRRFVLVAVLFVVASTVTVSGYSEEPVDYTRDIKPLLKNKCYACHGPVKQEAGLRLDAAQLLLAGGDDGKVVLPGESASSRLIARVSSPDMDERMPPEGAALSNDEIALMQSWIDQGAVYPADEVIAPKGDAHWSFQPIQSVAVPAVSDKQWPIDAIDHFVLARLENRGWHPASQAEPHAILRRVYLDIIGLPPTIAEQDAFLKSPSAEAYRQLVRDLIDRKGYGERYARHWLDVVRYADSNGYERDGAKPEVWRYRDWVIRALNNDKPFDRFVIEQLAGDEMAAADGESVLATGYNRLGPWDDEPADFAVDRFDQLDDLVSTTSQAFFALTLGCARCHDHKFDPLSQRDYYNLVAIFNPLQRPQQGRTEMTRRAAPPAQRLKLEQRDAQIAKLQGKIDEIRQNAQSAVLASGKSKLSPDVIAAVTIEASKRDEGQKKLVVDNQAKLDVEVQAALSGKLMLQIDRMQADIAELKRTTPDVPQGYFLYEPSPEPPVTHLLVRGSPSSPGERVEPAVPAVLVKRQPVFFEPDEFTSRRRLSLAHWLTNESNPLTSRVIVNRVWQWHFGQGLVRTSNNFGLLGERPTHPDLLDYLAHWFVHEADWSLKKLHVKIMTSRTYQMSRTRRVDYAQVDPDNRLLWRTAYRRLEVEAIRDSMLAVSGRLNRQMYGPAMHPFIPRDALLNHADKTSIWPPFDEQQASRRTIYAFIKRSLLVPMLEVFDLCDTTRTSPKRAVTTVPTQALTLYNGDFVNRQAEHLASRLEKEAGDTLEKQINHAWRLAFCRRPSASELNAMRAFFDGEVEHLRGQSREDAAAIQLRHCALVQLCRVILNLNELVYPD